MVAVDGPRDREAKIVVELGNRKHFDPVVDARDGGDFRNPVLDVRALVGHRDLADERDATVVHVGVNAVENREMRIPQYLLLDVTEQLQVLTLRCASWRADHERDDGRSHQFG